MTSFRLLVHQSDIDVDTGNESSFEKPDEKPTSVKSVMILDEGYTIVFVSAFILRYSTLLNVDCACHLNLHIPIQTIPQQKAHVVMRGLGPTTLSRIATGPSNGTYVANLEIGASDTS